MPIRFADLTETTLYLQPLKNGENDLVAQLVEQYTFNVRVLGSSPSGVTLQKAV